MQVCYNGYILSEPKTPKLTTAEQITLVLGFVLLIVGIILAITNKPETAPAREVKQQNILVEIDDFKGDPAVYDAIQKQLGNPERSAPTPQVQQDSAPHDTGAQLQSTATGLQAR
jgi:hypothetical protein